MAPAVPIDAVAASFGLTIDAPGTLTIDDLGFVDGPPAAAPPRTAPRVKATDPGNPTGHSADSADRSDTGNWLGMAGITIALLGLLAGLLHNYWRKTR